MPFVETIEHPLSMDNMPQLSGLDVEEIGIRQMNLSREDEDAMDQIRVKWKISYEQRYGVRPSVKTFPWPNASNLHIPVTDKVITRKKPALAALTWGVKPHVIFEPTSVLVSTEEQTRAEQFFDWLLDARIPDFKQESILADDSILERGWAVMKTTYDFKRRKYVKMIDVEDHVDVLASVASLDEDSRNTDLSPEDRRMAHEAAIAGIMEDILQISAADEENRAVVEEFLPELVNKIEGTVTLNLEEDAVNAPRVTAVDLNNIIVPSNTGFLGEATRITHKMFLTVGDLKSKENAGVYKNIDEVENLLVSEAEKEFDDDTRAARREREERDLDRVENDEVEIWEMYFMLDIDGKGEEEKVVMTIEETTGVVIRDPIRLPFDHGEWPFVQIQTELNDRGYFSARGDPEKIKDLQTEINVQHNGKIDRMTIANAPMFTVVTGSGITESTIQFIPGQMIPIKRQGDIQPFQVPNLDISFEREENILRQNIEEYVGIVDFGLSSITNPVERRTATEVDAIQVQSERTFSMDATVYQEGRARMYHQILALWNQYGPNRIEIMVTGTPITVLKEEIIGRFRLVPKGNNLNSSRVLEKQRAFQRFQVFAGDNTGMINKWELFKDFLEKDDPIAAKRILNPMNAQVGNQQERQAQELIYMSQGFAVDISPNDDPVEHSKVIEVFIQTEEFQGLPQDRKNLILEHAQQHQEQLDERQKFAVRQTERTAIGGFRPVEQAVQQ